jgi:hypothetical protein
MPPSSTGYDSAAFLNQCLRLLPTPLLTPDVLNRHLRTDDLDIVWRCLCDLSAPVPAIFAQICAVVESIFANSAFNHLSHQNMPLCFGRNRSQSWRGLLAKFL